MLYYSLINLGIGEMSPSGSIQLAFCFISMLISSLMFLNIFGEIVCIYSVLLTKFVIKQQTLDRMNELMKSFNFDDKVSIEINVY